MWKLKLKRCGWVKEQRKKIKGKKKRKTGEERETVRQRTWVWPHVLALMCLVCDLDNTMAIPEPLMTSWGPGQDNVLLCPRHSGLVLVNRRVWKRSEGATSWSGTAWDKAEWNYGWTIRQGIERSGESKSKEGHQSTEAVVKNTLATGSPTADVRN